MGTLTQFYSLSLFFFFFSRKGMKMDLLITISILCFVSLVAGTPASDGVKDDFADEPQVKRKTPVRKTARMLFESALGGRRMEEANRQADQRLLPDFANADIPHADLVVPIASIPTVIQREKLGLAKRKTR